MSTLSIIQGGAVPITITQVDTGASLKLSQPGVDISITQADPGAALSLVQGGAVEIGISQIAGASLTLGQTGGAAITLAVPGSIAGPQGSTGDIGPEGPQGPPGNPAAGAIYNVEFTGVGAGQSVSLPVAPSALKMLVIQGLVEQPDEYTVSGATLVIPPGLLWDGARCQFVFS